MYHSVLVPLDGSALAEQALPWALSLARRTGSRLDLARVHVLYAFKDPTAAWAPYNPVMEAETRQEEQLYLDATCAWIKAAARVEVGGELLGGMTVDGVLQRVKELRSGLIVMATHRLGPIGRFFLGSVADELIQRGVAPMLLVPRSDPPPGLIPEPALFRILIPLDGSTLAEQALTPGRDLAHVMEAKCMLLRVVEGDSAVAEAEGYLRRAAEPLRAAGEDVALRVVSARTAAEGIVQEAKRETGTLIALATHGRGGLSRMLLGSVADKVIRAAPVPVLVSRPLGV